MRTIAASTPRLVRYAVVGLGHARKEQVQAMVARLLELPGLPGKDAADALGLAVCHAHAARSFAAIDRAAGRQSRTSAQYKAGRSY